LGCQFTEHKLIQVNDFGMTSVPGVYAAGDTTTMMRQVANAVAGGAKTGAVLNRELITDDLRQRTQSEFASH
jgi:thioredoxin reductase